VSKIDNPVLKAIKSRRSHRAFAPTQLTSDEIGAIMEAAIWAPSANNRQAWHFSVVQDQAFLDRIVAEVKAQAATLPDNPMKERMSSPDYHTFYHAPTVVFISAEESTIGAVDASVAAQNILLAAESLDIGSVLIMSHALAFRGPAGADIRGKLEVPDGYQILQAISLGHKAGEPEPPTRKTDVVTYVR
jgi:nitroreductase